MDDENADDSAQEEIHQELLDKVDSVSRRTRAKQRTEGAVVASEFHLAPTHQDGKVAMASLIKGFGSTQDKALVDLSKKLSSLQEKSQPMETPLNKIQADRVNREAANKLTCKQVGKWAPIVKKNREAEHLSFPLQPDHVPPPSLAMKLETFEPSTELEKEVAAILSRSETVKSEEQELTEAERKSLFQMSIEEAMERKKQLQRHRALVSLYEQKCRRIRRIKSKKFHKVRRKHLEKVSGKQECTDEDLMKLRAKERMTLKHTNKAKWARKQHSREHRDPATQQALTEHHQRKTQLKEKLPPVPEDEEDEEEKGDSGEESEGNEGISGSRVVFTDSENPWLSCLTTSKDQSKSEESRSPGAKVPVQPHIVSTSFIKTDVRTGKAGVGRRKSEVEEGLGRASKQLLSIREAFAGDDVVEEFEKEKEELEKKATMTDAPTALPGWGSWGGMGVKASKRRPKIQKAPADPPKKPRKDAGMKHVIIAEDQIGKKLARHLVQSVPWPYSSKEQFDKTHCMPIGRHWNTEATYQQMIQPRVTTKAGEVIKPLALTEEVQNYIERESAKKEKKKKRTKKIMDYTV